MKKIILVALTAVMLNQWASREEKTICEPTTVRTETTKAQAICVEKDLLIRLPQYHLQRLTFKKPRHRDEGRNSSIQVKF